MTEAKVPTYFKTEDENVNRRQDSEDTFIAALLDEPREFLRNAVQVIVVAEGTGGEPIVDLQHGLGFPAHGWVLTRVTLAAGSVAGPSLPFTTTALTSDNNVLQVFIEDAGTYQFMVY